MYNIFIGMHNKRIMLQSKTLMSIPESFQFSPFPIFNNNSACDTHVEFLDLSLVDLFNSAIFVCQFPIAIAVDLDALDENVPSFWDPKVLFCTEINQKCK